MKRFHKLEQKKEHYQPIKHSVRVGRQFSKGKSSLCKGEKIV